MNLPTKITLFRVVLIPFFIAVLMSNFQQRWFLACCIFLAASVSDYFDGKIARKKLEVTDFGKFLDPLADKILVLSALLCFVELKIVKALPVILIISREFFVTALRFNAALKNKIISSNKWGKIKTVIQMNYVTFSLLLFVDNFRSTKFSEIFISVGIWILVAVSLSSLASYVVQNKKILSFK